MFGGAITMWMAEEYLGSTLGLTEESEIARWQYYLLKARLLPPRPAVRACWVVRHRPGQRPVGLGTPRLQSHLRRGDGLYGWTVGRLLRVSAVVLLVYGALTVPHRLGHGAWQPTGFIPAQDQGYLLASVQLPDSASVQHQGNHGTGGENRRGTPGVGHTVAVSGQSFLLGTNGSNLGSMFVVLDPYSKRRTRDTYGTEIARKIQTAVCPANRIRRGRRLSLAADPRLGQRGRIQLRSSSMASWTSRTCRPRPTN